MSKIPFRNINIGVNVAEHSRRDYNDQNSSYTKSNDRGGVYRNNSAKKEVKGNAKNIIPVIILFVVIYFLYEIFK